MRFSITTPGCGDFLDKAGQCARCLTDGSDGTRADDTNSCAGVRGWRVICGGPGNLRMNLGDGVSLAGSYGGGVD